MPLGKAGVSRSFGAPGKYFQGPGELELLPEHCARLECKSAMLIIDPFFYEAYRVKYEKSFAEAGMEAHCIAFGGDCTDAEIERIRATVKDMPTDTVVGIGGGKTVDTAKSVAHRERKPLIVCPTSLATDAATSTHSIIYDENHVGSMEMHRNNPEIVVVDTAVAVTAPPRLFAAGMADAMATYVEARACLESGNMNHVGSGYRQTKLGFAIAKLCWDIILERGDEAYLSARTHIWSEAYEDVAEANTLLSGIGFENTGCSIAHGIQASMVIAPETNAMMHGEVVAFGILCELFAEKRPMEEINRVFGLFKGWGLPTTLAELGIRENVEETVMKIVRFGLENKTILKVEPFAVTEETLYNAIMYTDAFARERA